MKKTVSVVIPNYNGINYCKACLQAMRRQTRPADRLIVVDNGSTDGSAEEILRDKELLESNRMELPLRFQR